MATKCSFFPLRYRKLMLFEPASPFFLLTIMFSQQSAANKGVPFSSFFNAYHTTTSPIFLFDCHFFYIYYNGVNNSHHSYRGAPMTTAEKISIALPSEMVHLVRGAVATGEYASSSEVIRDALRDWTYKRSLRQQGVAELRRVWQEALNDTTSDISPDVVLDRLERKYQAIADGFFRHT